MRALLFCGGGPSSFDRAGIDVDVFAFAYLIGRLVHYPAQAIGPMLPAVRTLAFGVSWSSCLLIGYMLVL